MITQENPDLNIFSELFKEYDCVGISEFPDIPGDSYSLFGNGLFIKKNVEGIGFFCINKYPMQIPLDKNFSESFSLDLKRKIPFEVLRILKDIYSNILIKIKSEVMALVYYNKATDTFRVNVPPQKVNFSNVSYTYSPPLENEILILNSHSHSNFSAFFSAVDSADEKAPCFYLVIGNNDKDERSYALRVKYGNFEKSFGLEDIFDFDNKEEKVLFDESEMENIEQVTYASQFTSRVYGRTNYYSNHGTKPPKLNNPYGYDLNGLDDDSFFNGLEDDFLFERNFPSKNVKSESGKVDLESDKLVIESSLRTLKYLIEYGSPMNKIYKKLTDIIELIDKEKGPEFEDFLLDLQMMVEED